MNACVCVSSCRLPKSADYGVCGIVHGNYVAMGIEMENRDIDVEMADGDSK